MAGRHLANHNVKVTVCAVAQGQRLQPHVLLALRTFTAAGGTFCESLQGLAIAPLQPINLVVDAIFSWDTLDSPYAQELTSLIRFANKQNVPIVSLEVPSGINWSTGNSEMLLRGSRRSEGRLV